MTDRRGGDMTNTPIGAKRQRQLHTDESWTPGGRPSSGTAIPQGYSPRVSLTHEASSTPVPTTTTTNAGNRRRDARRPEPLRTTTEATPSSSSYYTPRPGGHNRGVPSNMSPRTATTPYSAATTSFYHRGGFDCGGDGEDDGGMYHTNVWSLLGNPIDPHLDDRLRMAADEFWSPTSQQPCASDAAPETPIPLSSPQLTANDISYHSALREALMPLSQRSQGRDPTPPPTTTRRQASSFTPLTPQLTAQSSTPGRGGELRLWKALSHPFSEYSNFKYTHMTMFATNVIIVSTPANLIHYDIDRRESTIVSIYDSPTPTHNCVVRQMSRIPQNAALLGDCCVHEKFVLAFGAPMVRTPFEFGEEEGNVFPFDESVERDGEVGALHPRSRAIRGFLERSTLGWESSTMNAPSQNDGEVEENQGNNPEESISNVTFHEDVVSSIYVVNVSPSVPTIGATKVSTPFPVGVVATHPTCVDLVVVGSASGPCVCTIDTSLIRKEVGKVMRGTLSGATNEQIGSVSCLCVSEVNHHHQLVFFGTTHGHVFIFHLATGAQRAHMYLGFPITTIAYDKWLVVCSRNGQVHSYSLNLPFLQRGSEVMVFGGGDKSNSSIPDSASLFDEVSTADMEIPITTLAVSVSSLELFANHEPFAAIGMANGEVRLVTLPDLRTISNIMPQTVVRGNIRDHHKDIQYQGVTTLVLGPLKPAASSQPPQLNDSMGSTGSSQKRQGGGDEIGLIVERLNRNIEPFQIHSRLPCRKQELGEGGTTAPWNPTTWFPTHSDRCR